MNDDLPHKGRGHGADLGLLRHGETLCAEADAYHRKNQIQPLSGEIAVAADAFQQAFIDFATDGRTGWLPAAEQRRDVGPGGELAVLFDSVCGRHL